MQNSAVLKYDKRFILIHGLNYVLLTLKIRGEEDNMIPQIALGRINQPQQLACFN